MAMTETVPTHPLKALRDERGLTQLELAVETGLSVGTISRTERGACRPTDRVRVRLARFFGVEPWEVAPYVGDEIE